MSWQSYFFPRLLGRFSSIHNHDILVVEEKGKNKLLVNGSRQSGAYIENLWKTAFDSFSIQPSANGYSILVLGIGGGTVIHLLSRMYPRAQIEGIDIDQKIIDIGRKYFGLARVSNLTMKRTDAKTHVANALKRSRRYDMIIVDLFIGRHIPSFVSSKQFLAFLRKILGTNGKLLINFLQENEYGKKSDVLLDKLVKIFQSVKDKRIYRNRFFLAYS